MSNNITIDKTSITISIDISYDKINLKTKNNNSFSNLKLLSKISEIIHDSISEYCKPKISWLISDDKFILENFERKKNSIVYSNDEVGIHSLLPLFVDLSYPSKMKIKNYLEKKKKLFKEFSFNPLCSRIMGCVGSNEIISSLDEMGIKVDSSALANRVRNFDIKFNWEKTPPKPYFPSVNDYRIPSKTSHKGLKIIEAPITTIKTKTKKDARSINRYLDLGFREKLVCNQIKKINTNIPIITIIHPEKFLKSNSNEDFYDGKIITMKRNLNEMLNRIIDSKKKISCSLLSELSVNEKIKSNQNETQ